MFNKLSTRLIASHLLVIAIAMTLLGFLLLSLAQSYFEQALQTSLITQARLTTQALVSSNASNLTPVPLPAAQNIVQQSQITAPTQNVSPTLDNTTLRLSAELETRIRVTDARGIVQADSANTERGRDVSSDPAIAAALRGQEFARTLDDSIFVAVPLRRDARIVGAVYLSQPMRDVAAVLADLRARLLLSAAISLALSALVGLLLARAIARPVRELTRAAHRLAQGDFDYPLPDKSSDELGELARAFRAMSRDLQRTLQARTDLVSNVSHELRTPLTAIKGLIETLRDGAVDDLNARDKFLASIEGETDRLIRLVNDLLVLSRADSQALTLHREKFDLTALARACADQLTTARVAIVIEGEPAPVDADPDRIRQVLVNLLDNAIRFSPPGEVVRVTIESASDGMIVSVQDRGPGIPAAEQARVFERFYRADKSRARDAGAGGAGLGLSIAQTLVQAHGGQIALESHAGQGTTVRFKLPAA
ncbi:MAG: cell wall metabolism sensor histidine kinase WalK [Chloroflexi bacterium]|nr:cell wall metabolism sensor histidine kinase WalK [Chloroflexota bacterium]